MRDEIRRMALVTSGIVELTRNRAENIARDMIASGDISGGQAAQVVKELRERSRQNRREIMKLVRNEIRGQIEALGVATKRDIERLERRVARLEDRPSAPTTKKGSKKTAKKTSKKTAKKKTSKKSTRKSTASAEPSSMPTPTPENPST